MRKTKVLAAGTLALFLSSVGGVGTTSQVMAQGTPTLTPTLTVTKSGDLATFVLLVKNNRTGNRPNGAPYALDVVDVKLKVPAGTQVVGTWALQGPGRNPGRYTGGDQSIGWVKRQWAAGKTEGPWIMTVNTGGQDVCSFAWVRATAGPDSGSWTSDPVCTGPAASDTSGETQGTGGGSAPQPLQPLTGGR